MISMVLLSLLGIGMAAFAFDVFGDDDEDPAPVRDEDVDDTVTDTDGGTIEDTIFTGTDGNDVIMPDGADEFPNEVRTFNMVGGDDSVDFGRDNNITINGGDGNDTLSIDNEENLLDGGAGDDVLSAGLGSTVVGGEGDDSIVFDQSDGVLDGRGEVRGGEGDDTIGVATDIGFIVSDNGPVDVFGGDGNDSFTVAIDQVPEDALYDPRGSGEDSTLVNIEDFTPGDDMLVVDVSPLKETSGRNLLETELTALPDGGYELALRFSGTDANGPLVTTLNIDGPGPITLDDIAILSSGAGPSGAGEVIEVTDQETVTGSDGNDTITGAEPTFALNLLSAVGGDDQIDLAFVDDFAEIDGGAGNDTITANAFESTISGGAGDDVMDLNPQSSRVDGGDGDDVIEVAQSFNESSTPAEGAFTSSGSSSIAGGAGDDILGYDVATDPRATAFELTGGDGTDTFALDVTTTDYGFTTLSEEELFEFDDLGNLIGEVETPVVRDTIAVITDFQPGVDQLQVDLRDTHDEVAGAHTLASVATEETADGTYLRMTFDAVRPDDPDALYELVASVFLRDVSGLDLEHDVTLIT